MLILSEMTFFSPFQSERFLTLWTCYDLGAMATKVRRHDTRVHPYQRIVTADRGQFSLYWLMHFNDFYAYYASMP